MCDGNQCVQQVSFQWKNPDFLLKNPDFLLKNVDFIIIKGSAGAAPRAVADGDAAAEGAREREGRDLQEDRGAAGAGAARIRREVARAQPLFPLAGALRRPLLPVSFSRCLAVGGSRRRTLC